MQTINDLQATSTVDSSQRQQKLLSFQTRMRCALQKKCVRGKHENLVEFHILEVPIAASNFIFK